MARAKGRGSAGDPQADLPHQDRVVRREINDMGQKTNPIGLRLAVNRDWRPSGTPARRIRQAADRRPPDPRDAQEEARVGVGAADPHRASGQPRRITSYTAASGRRHRPQGRGHRQAARRAEPMTGKRDYVNIEEVKQARNRRAAGGRNDRAAARAADQFRRAMKKALQTAKGLGAEGIKIVLRRAAWAARKSPAASGTARARAAAHAARGHRLRLRRGQDDLRHPRHQVLDLQGRGRFRQAAEPPATPGPRLTGSERATAQIVTEDSHAATANQVPQGPKGPQRRRGRAARSLRVVRPQGDRTRPAHRRQIEAARVAIDASRQARRQDVDPHLPGQADHQEAGRSPHGQRQGTA